MTRISRTSPASRSWGRTISPSEERLLAAGLALALLLFPSALRGAGGEVAPATGVHEVAAEVRAVEADRIDVAQEAARTHVVKEGDTLWGLARRYLADPHGWERIWELNRDVLEDPAALPVGVELRIPVRAETADAGAGEDVGAGEGVPEARREAQEREAAFGGPSIFDSNPRAGIQLSQLELGADRRPLLVSPSDAYRASYVGRTERLRSAGRTVRVLKQNVLGLDLPPGARLRDQVLITLGELEVSEGDLLHAIREGRSLDGHGKVMHPMALLRVLELRDGTARARVDALYGAYELGDPVVPLPPVPPDVRSLREAEGTLTARVLGLEVEQVLPGQGELLYLDAGSVDGVTVGDEFAVFAPEVESPTDAAQKDHLATVRVVRTEETSSARIVRVLDVGLRPGASALRIREPIESGG